MSDVAKIRKRIEKAKKDLTRAEGEHRAVEDEIDETLESLREALDCEEGEEKEAMKALRASLAKDEAELTKLLDAADEAAQGD